MSDLFDDRAIERRALLLGGAAAGIGCALPAVPLAAAPARAGVPRLSDVVVSVRKANDTSSDRALAAYHPNRLEWHYVTDVGFIRRAKSRFDIGYASGTINASLGPGGNPDWYARGFGGEPLSAPWMTGWGVLWLSVAADAARARQIKYVDAALAAGCDGIQVDDGWFQLISEEWGGDFSDASRAGFGPWLETNTTAEQRAKLGLPASTRGYDYRDWLRGGGIQSTADYVAKRKALPTTPLWRRYLAANVRDFWRMLRTHVGNIPLSMNFGVALPNDNFLGLADMVDYTMCEFPADDDAYRYRLFGASAEAAGLPFVGHFVNHPPSGSFRQNIAICYASGVVAAAPWDVFVPNAGGTMQPRIFGDPASYADLYDFVRAHAALFDGYGDGARVGLAVPVESYAGGRFMQPLVRALFEAGVPYRIIPIGGTYRQVRPGGAALSGLTTLVLSHPRSSFSAAELVALGRTGLPLVDAATLADRESIGAMVASQGWTLVHRRNARASRSVIHVVPTAFGTAVTSGAVRLRHGTTTQVERATRARLHRPGKPSVLLAPSGRSAAATLFELPTVTDWAMIELLPA